MIIKRTIAVAVIALLAAGHINAKLNLPTKKLGNESYYYYEVKKNETVADIASRLGISRDDIIKYNPSARDGVTKKQLIFLPVKDFDKTTQAVQPDRQVNVATLDQAITHTVKNGESVYGIAKTYGITEGDLLNANPSIVQGLKVGSQLTIPTKNYSGKDNQFVYHTINSGESLYGLAKKYNTSIENLIELNPGVNNNNLKAGEVIRIIPNKTQDIVIKKDIYQFSPYVVAAGDTYESVAAANGLTTDELKKANPDMAKLKKGKTIYIPRKAVDSRVVSTASLSEQQLENEYKGKLTDIYNNAHSPNKDNNSIDISIILPFQLGMKDQTKNAKNYEEFYNGFLLALDSVGANLTVPLNLTVHDTKHNLNYTDSILKIDELKKSDIIIAPSEPKQLERILKFGKDNNIDVLNCFATQNEDYMNNSHAIQVNVPSPYLNSMILEMIDSQFEDYVLVFLDDPQGGNKDIYDEIKRHATETKHPNKTLTIASELTGKTLSKYLEPGSNYLFIPANGKENFLSRFENGIKEAKETRIDCELVLLGHPEYTLYLGKHRESLMNIDTYIYSRFYLPQNDRVNSLNSKYQQTFGSKATNSVPNMSVFGFDTGMFLVNMLGKNLSPDSSEAHYNGLQTNFSIERANNWAGYINKSVKIVHLTPKKELIITDLNE